MIGAIWLIVGVEDARLHPRFLLSGIVILFAIATLMAFAFLVGVDHLVDGGVADGHLRRVLPRGHPGPAHDKISAAVSTELAAAGQGSTGPAQDRRARQGDGGSGRGPRLRRSSPSSTPSPSSARRRSSASPPWVSRRGSFPERTSDHEPLRIRIPFRIALACSSRRAWSCSPRPTPAPSGAPRIRSHSCPPTPRPWRS